MKQNKTIIAIIIVGVLIAGALVFLGLQLGTSNNTAPTASFAEQLEQYQQEQQQAQLDAQAEQERLAEEKAKSVNAPDEDDHVLGDRNALISLIEYSDFECPFCKRFHDTPKQILKDNPDVNWVYRHFPLGFHDPLATQQAEASECVADLKGNDAFWEYSDLIFETTNSNMGMEASQLTDLAVQIGVNKNAFQSCLDSEQFAQNVQDDIQSGVNAGITGTPGNIIRNNETGEVILISGAYPIKAIQAAIDELRGE